MVVQFELGSKHLENKKLAAEAIQALKGKNTKEIVAELMAKSYGSIPSDKALYNDYLGLAVSLEEIAKVSPEAASILVDQLIAAELYTGCGNSSDYSSREVYAVLCAEPGIANLSKLGTKASKTSSGWHVEGKKQIRGEHLTADKYLVYAVDEAGKTRVFCLSENNIGVTQQVKEIAGTNININIAEINVDLPENSCIAEINNNMEQIMTVARTMVAAVALGIGHSAVVASINVAKEVKGADNQSISATQSMQFTLADMYSELEASRMLTYYSADLIDSKKSNIKYATMAKVKSTDTASSVSLQALQVLGTLGYLANNEFADILRFAVDSQTRGGTNRTQRNQIYQHLLAKK